MNPPKVIYGPPGTGKTSTLVNMVGEMTGPVLVCSYTKAAAREIRERVPEDGSGRIEVGTIHSVCFGLLGLTKDLVVDNRKLARFCDLLGMGSIESEYGRTEVGEYVRILSMSKALCISPEECLEINGNVVQFDGFVRFVNLYERWKKRFGLFDFDDMLVEVLTRGLSPEVGSIVVDEAQDLSDLQWLVVKMWARKSQLVVAGDDDQSIYQWAGANPVGMLDLHGDEMVLGIGHRVPAAILAQAVRQLSPILKRKKKRVVPASFGGDVMLSAGASVDDVICSNANSMVLVRTNRELAAVKGLLVEMRAPFSVIGGRSIIDSRAFLAASIMCSGGPRDDIEREVVDEHWKSGNRKLPKVSFDVERYIFDVIDGYGPSPGPAYVIGTAHSAKGLEHDNVVWYTDMSGPVLDGFLVNPDPEFRLSYVAMTRARKKLTVVVGKNPVLI